MAQKPYQKTKRKRIGYLPLVLLTYLVIQMAFVLAPPTDEDFQEILTPLETIYDFAKYASTTIAGLVALFAGITYISSGSDPGKREKAKNMIMYVLIGIMVIWAAPFVIDLLIE